jgi:ferrous iron transport protein A
MAVSLATLRPGQSGVVAGFDRSDELTQRLMHLGVIDGTPLEVLRCAPTGDPMEIRVMGYALSLRRSEAEAILIDEVR